jgi:hypothetical protein
LITLAVSLAVLVTGGIGQAAASPVREAGVQQIAPGSLPDETFDALVDVYTVVESMPPEFETMGDEQGAAQWLRTEFDNRGWLGGCPQCARVDVARCVFSVALFIASVVTQAGQVLLLFRVLKRIGTALGVVAGIDDALTRSHDQQRDARETLREVFADIGEMVVDLLPVGDIVDNCFS